MVAAPMIAISQEDEPPRAILCLNKIPMPCALDLLVLPLATAVCQDRVGWVRLVRSLDIPATGDGEPVCQLCPSL